MKLKLVVCRNCSIEPNTLLLRKIDRIDLYLKYLEDDVDDIRDTYTENIQTDSTCSLDEFLHSKKFKEQLCSAIQKINKDKFYWVNEQNVFSGLWKIEHNL
jgi:hypothetical protein